MYGTNQNDLLQLDYIEIGPSLDSAKYVPMLHVDYLDYNGSFLMLKLLSNTTKMPSLIGVPLSKFQNCLMRDETTHF